jgi:hypothetical protein
MAPVSMKRIPSCDPSRMIVVIPTRGRVDSQMTLSCLPTKWLRRTMLICPQDEAKAHIERHERLGITVQPEPRSISNSGEKRCWILSKLHYEKIIMIDDDLEFFLREQEPEEFRGVAAGYSRQGEWDKYRKEHPGSTRLYRPQRDDPRLAIMFDKFEKMLDKYAHLGMSQRFMNYTGCCEWLQNKKARQVMAFRLPTVRHNIDLKPRLPLCGDYDITLQLFRKGFQNAVFQWGAVNEPRGYDAPGGCSSYRNFLLNNRCKIKLAELHPGIVKVHYENEAQLETPHIDFRIYWQRAIAEGKRKRTHR